MLKKTFLAEQGEMVAAGVMEGVDYIVGAHLWASLEVGKVGVIYGPAWLPQMF